MPNVMPVAESFLQSPAWFEFQRAYGRQVVGRFIQYPLPLGQSYWFSPYGEQPTTTELAALPSGALFVRYEPMQTPAHAKRVHDVHPSSTWLTVLGDDAAMLKAMKQKCRYNIKVAERHAVTVTSVTDSNQIDVWYGLFAITAKRQGIRLHPKAYYKLMVDTLVKHQMVKVYIAWYQQQPLAAAIVVYHGHVATYLHGGSSDELRNVMAPHALHWQVMRDARDAGFMVYDWFGISKQWPGVSRFKESFGGEPMQRAGTFEHALRPMWYTAYRLIKRVWIS